MAFQTQTGTFEGYNRLEIIERILWNLGQVASGSVVYTRYPKTLIVNVINETARDLAVAYPTIRKICIVNTVADKGWYLCPAGMIPNGIDKAYYYTSTTQYDELEVMDRARLDREYPGWRVASSGTPLVIVPGPLYGNRFTFEVYPAPDTSGSWDTQPTGVYLGGAPSTMTTSVSGIATGGGASYLADTGGGFSDLGLVEGMAVWNVTDSLYGWIQDIGDSRISLTASLVTDRDGSTASGAFAAGDAYEIVTDYAGVVSDWDDDDEQYIFTAETGTISDFQPQADNILLEYWAYPISMTIDTDYPQMPKTLQDALIDMATAKLARMGHEKTRQMELADRHDARAGDILSLLPNDRMLPFRDAKYNLKVRMPR